MIIYLYAYALIHAYLKLFILTSGTSHSLEDSFTNTIVVNDDDGVDRPLPVPVLNFVTVATSECHPQMGKI